MSLEYRIGDVFERLAEIPDGSIDLIVTSPPFYQLRSYLPKDHEDKHREIGSESTPAEFLDTLLALTAEFGRVLAPHGSICVELGDTYSGSGGGGGDYLPGGLRENQPGFGGSAAAARAGNAAHWRAKNQRPNELPLAKSRICVDLLYPPSLAYGRNLLNGQPSPAGQWRIRNVIVWARPNPPVGALGDKFRPATSYITVACRSSKRYFDLDAVRTEPASGEPRVIGANGSGFRGITEGGERSIVTNAHRAGAPPLDWHADNHPEDGDWLWKLSTQPYAGSHYATFPLALPTRLIQAMCPLRVCTVCGRPSERITGDVEYVPSEHYTGQGRAKARSGRWDTATAHVDASVVRTAPTVGWTDCGHRLPCQNGLITADGYDHSWCGKAGTPPCDDGTVSAWRTGTVLDPFAGSGTTLEAAQAVGRHAIGIDLDSRNGDLARERVGMFLEIQEGAA